MYFKMHYNYLIFWFFTPYFWKTCLFKIRFLKDNKNVAIFETFISIHVYEFYKKNYISPFKKYAIFGHLIRTKDQIVQQHLKIIKMTIFDTLLGPTNLTNPF